MLISLLRTHQDVQLVQKAFLDFTEYVCCFEISTLQKYTLLQKCRVLATETEEQRQTHVGCTCIVLPHYVHVNVVSKSYTHMYELRLAPNQALHVTSNDVYIYTVCLSQTICSNVEQTLQNSPCALAANCDIGP